MNLDAEIAAAREHLHRSIGQRARWARYAIAERTERERAVMHRALNRLYEPPPVDPRSNMWPTDYQTARWFEQMQNMQIDSRLSRARMYEMSNMVNPWLYQQQRVPFSYQGQYSQQSNPFGFLFGRTQ